MISCSSRMPDDKPVGQDLGYAVLIMSYGGPDSLDDIEPFLLDIRGGRPTSAELIDEIKERYALIGGKSPLLEITCDQAEALEKRLNEADGGQGDATKDGYHRVYVGMRHWTPFIKDTLAEMLNDGVKRVVTLCMTPYYSDMTVGAYLEKFAEAQQALCPDLDVTHIKHWHTNGLYIDSVVEKIQAALERFPEEAREQVQVIFTAHSLPESIIAKGDPYDAHLRETATLIIQKLTQVVATSHPFAERWTFCYQSAGARQVKWLGPPIEEVIVKMAQEGYTQQLVVPIGFLVDHVEILYDLDIECQELALQQGVTLKRTDSLNASPTFINALADIVKQAVA